MPVAWALRLPQLRDRGSSGTLLGKPWGDPRAEDTVKLGKPESGEEGSLEAEEEGLGGWGRTQGGTGEAQHPDTQPA